MKSPKEPEWAKNSNFNICRFRINTTPGHILSNNIGPHILVISHMCDPINLNW